MFLFGPHDQCRQEAVRHTAAQLGSLRRGLADKASYADVQTLLGKVQGRVSMLARQENLADIDEGDAESSFNRAPMDDAEEVRGFPITVAGGPPACSMLSMNKVPNMLLLLTDMLRRQCLVVLPAG